MFHTQPDIFDAIREGWLRIEAEGTFEGIDPEVVPVLKLFNQLPGVVSFMSCAGHFEKKRSTTYVSFAFTAEGLVVVTEVFSRLREKYIRRWPKHNTLDPSPRNLILGFSSRGWINDEIDCDWWNSGSITFIAKNHDVQRHDESRNEFLRMFEEALSETLETL